MSAVSLADKLTASAARLDAGTVAAAEPALDLKVVLELQATELLKIAGGMDERLFAGLDDIDRQHLARARKAAKAINEALDQLIGEGA